MDSSTAERMSLAARADPDLPCDLMCAAWDRIVIGAQDPDPAASRAAFEAALLAALDAYDIFDTAAHASAHWAADRAERADEAPHPVTIG